MLIHIQSADPPAAGNVEVVQALIAAGADLEASSEAGTALVWAAGSGTAPVVAALLDAGASPAATAEGNISGVFMAAASGEHPPRRHNDLQHWFLRVTGLRLCASPAATAEGNVSGVFMAAASGEHLRQHNDLQN